MTSDVAALRERLAHERDAFQRNHLFRAMCDAQDHAAAIQFIRELDGSAARRALNRGCFLRRFAAASGPLTQAQVDAPSVTDWSAARQNFLNEACQPGLGPDTWNLRSVLDLYTFFDFCVTRGDLVRGLDAELLASMSDAMWNSRAVPVEIAVRVLSLAAVCTTEAQQQPGIGPD
jgi:hypothetical protein